MCLDSHESHLKHGGMTTEQIQTALRIAAVVNAAATAMVSAQMDVPALAQAA
jgi:alkyl hydroperoxide reductase subunit D